MANFCIKCGKRLSETGICSCERSEVEPKAKQNLGPYQIQKENKTPIFESVKENKTPVFESVKENKTPVFESVKENKTLVFESVKENKAPIFESVKENKTPIFESVKENKTPIFESVKENKIPVFEPIKKTHSYEPIIETNNQSSVKEVSYEAVSSEVVYDNVYHNEVDYAKKANQAKEVLSSNYKHVLNLWMDLLKYPLTKGVTFSTSDNIKSASIMISLQATLVAIFTSIMFSKINDMMDFLVYEIIGFMGFGGFEFPTANIFIITIMGSAAFSFIYAGTLLGASILLKNNISYSTAICSMASRSAIISAISILSIVFLLY